MVFFQGLLLLVLGVGVLVIDYRSLSNGWLPGGSNGLKGRLEVRRDEHPAGYWALFAIYLMLGLLATVTALRIWAGNLPPLPLH